MKLWVQLQLWWSRIQAWWHYWLGASYRHWANARGDRESYHAAIREFDRALALNPTLAQAHLDRGILYWRELDHPRRALVDLTQALELDPELHEARFNRGVAYQQLGEYEAAIEEFQAYLAVGEHPYWREYAEKMVIELREWVEEEDHA